MMNFYLVASIGFVTALSSAFGDWQCGKINEQQLYNEKPETAIDEYPWIGRIYNLERDNTYRFACVAVLISKRHMLTPIHCVQAWSDSTPDYVLLGDSDYGNADTEPDCDKKERCAPLPKKYKIQDIALHSNYDVRRRINDIAIIHLEEDVDFNDYIQPICLPPDSIYSADMYAQYFHYSGYIRDHYPLITKKTKTVAHVIPRSRCLNLFEKRTDTLPRLDSSVICASYVGEFIFLSGSILMGVHVKDSILSNFYLLGILSYGTPSFENDEFVQYHVFMKTAAHINWIQNNINNSLLKFSNATTSNLLCS